MYETCKWTGTRRHHVSEISMKGTVTLCQILLAQPISFSRRMHLTRLITLRGPPQKYFSKEQPWKSQDDRILSNKEKGQNVSAQKWLSKLQIRKGTRAVTIRVSTIQVGVPGNKSEQESMRTHKVLVSMPLQDVDCACGICYSFLLDGAVPEKMCQNSRCSRPFHHGCLSEVGVGGGHLVLNLCYWPFPEVYWLSPIGTTQQLAIAFRVGAVIACCGQYVNSFIGNKFY